MKNTIGTAEDIDISIFDNMSMNDLREWQKDVVEKYGEDAHLSVGCIHGVYDLEVVYQREETDAEYKLRLEYEKGAIADIADSKAKSEVRERKELARLKKKYE